MKKAGKTLAEAIAARPTKEFDAKWATRNTAGEVFTKYVFIAA